MNVLFITDTINCGGKEILLLDICRNNSVDDFNIFIVSNGGDLEQDFLKSNAKYFQLNRRFPLDLKYIFSIRKIIKKFNVSIIHTHDAVSELHAYLAKIGLNIKIVHTYHGIIRKAYKDNFVEKMLSNFVDANIAVSNSFYKRLISLGAISKKKKNFIIYNGIDCKRILSNKGILKSELGLNNKIYLMGMIANFTEVKDHMTICRALPRVFEMIPNSRFAFIGAKSATSPNLYYDCVDFCKKNRIDDKVFFLGKRRDIGNILKSLDLFIFSSNTDTFGIAVAEAMLAGIPCLINDIPVLLEMSNNGKYAFIFKKGDAKDLISKVLFVNRNISKRFEVAIDAKKWAMSNFSIFNHISSLKEVYYAILKS